MVERIKNTVRLAIQPGRAMLIRSVEKFLRAHAVSATTFGRLAARDSRFVFDLRNGREPRAETEARVRSFIAGYEAALEARHAA